MMGMMGPMMGGMGRPEPDLFTNYRAGVSEALGMAGLAALAIALLVSVFITRMVAAPVRAMMQASQRIAEGHYDERVKVSGRLNRGEVDELAQMALSFNRMADTLEQTEEMRRQLIGDVTHELRTPLTTIEGYMEGLIDGVLPANAETYQEVYREADRLKRLVDDLQELSRVEAKAYELHRQPVAVKNLVDSLVKRLEMQFSDKGVKLVVEIPAGLPPVNVDEDRISQVLLNLTGNALQYTPEGGQVTLSARAVEREVQISIADTGIGIPVEHLPHVFTRFYRVDKSRARIRGGSGIGLTIARHLVEAHGGRIWVTSAGAGQGSTFTFSLPVV
jgi:histidine kinase